MPSERPESASTSVAKQSFFAALLESFALLRDRRLLTIFLFGAASGAPWAAIGSALQAWTQDAGFSLKVIGFIGVVAASYTFNFVWAPLLDRYAPPLFGALGRRRGWIMLMQLLLMLFTFGLAMTGPSSGLAITVMFGVFIGLCGATMDVSIDAYRVEIIERHEEGKIAHGAAMTTAGWYTGANLPAALMFILHEKTTLEWPQLFLGLVLLWPLMMLVVFWAKPTRVVELDYDAANERWRSISKRSPFQNQLDFLNQIAGWLVVTIVDPLLDFFRRNGFQLAMMLLMFVFFFKIGEAFMGRMSTPFYRQVGFNDAQIGVYSKLIGWWVVIVFSVVASTINARFGVLKGLFLGGVLMASTNLLFSVIAWAGPQEWLFVIAVVTDGFTGAFATVAFVAFLSSLTSTTYTATQYALLASLGNLARTTFASSSGWVVEDVLDNNWALFFIVTAVMVVPSLLMLARISQLLRVKQAKSKLELSQK